MTPRHRPSADPIVNGTLHEVLGRVPSPWTFVVLSVGYCERFHHCSQQYSSIERRNIYRERERESYDKQVSTTL
jgi:hypothetical protein